jgi:hypothetical protein
MKLGAKMAAHASCQKAKHRDMELGATTAAGAGTYHSPRTRRADPTTTNIHTELVPDI